MDNQYERIVRDNIDMLFEKPPVGLAEKLPGKQAGSGYVFDAFGHVCRIGPDGITLGDTAQTDVLGILISLYALNVNSDECIVEPMKGFKDFPDSMPYVGAFATHTEHILLSKVNAIKKALAKIVKHLKGDGAQAPAAGDFSFLVYPLPKVALGYIFYEADEDFPASVTCLYSSNANRFLPMDALADVGEYTSKMILSLLD